MSDTPLGNHELVSPRGAPPFPDAELAAMRPSVCWFLALLLFGLATLAGQLLGVDKVFSVAFEEGRLSIISKQLADRRESLAATESEYEESQKKLMSVTPQLLKATLSLESIEKDSMAAKKQRDNLLLEVNSLTKHKKEAEEALAALTTSDRTLQQSQQELAQARKDLDATKTALALTEPIKQKKDAELNDVTQQLETATAEMQTLQARLTTMRAQTETLEGKKAEEARIDGDIAAKTETFDGIVTKSANAEAQLKEQYSAFFKQKSETEALRASVATLTAEKRALEQDTANLKGQANELAKQLADLNSTIGYKTKERDALKAALEQTTTARDTLQKEVADLTQEKAGLTAEVESLKQRVSLPGTTESHGSPATPQAAPPSAKQNSPAEAATSEQATRQKLESSKDKSKTADSPDK